MTHRESGEPEGVDPLLEWGWNVIANVDWDAQTDEWRAAAKHYREEYFKRLKPVYRPD